MGEENQDNRRRMRRSEPHLDYKPHDQPGYYR